MYTNFLRSLTAVNVSHVFASSLILIFVAIYQAECYAALTFVHLWLESTFLPISRLATLFMHGLNTEFNFAALVVLFCAFALPFWFECTTTFDRPLFREVCPMHSVSVIMHVLAGTLAFLIFLYCYCCLVYRILSTLWLRCLRYCGYVAPVRLYIS